MKIAKHYTILIYPFQHDLSGHGRRRELRKLNQRWKPWWNRFNDDTLEDVLDDSFFFLPYVKNLLFPESAKLPKSYSIPPVPKARVLAGLQIEDWADGLTEDGVLHLTYDQGLLQIFNKLRLQVKHGQTISTRDFDVGVHVHWVDVTVFPQGVGFLTMKVHLTGDDCTVTNLTRFLSYVRLVLPPRVGSSIANWRCDTANGSLFFKSQDLVDYLLQGLADGIQEWDAAFETFITRAHMGSPMERYSTSEIGQVYGQLFREYSYVCLDPIMSSTEDSEREAESDEITSLYKETYQSSLFSSPEQQILYELATATQTSRPDYEPHPEGIKQLLEVGHIAIWANWQGLALHDNVVFLGTRPSNFTLYGLAHNVESDYFYLYLLALYQKVRLSWIAGEAMQHGSALHRNLREARSLWNDFMRFRNHYWFAEVTFKPQGIELYRRFHKGLGVSLLYDCISDEMFQLQAYYESKSERRVVGLVNFLAFVGLPAGILTQLFGSSLIKETNWEIFTWTAVLVYIGIFITWGIVTLVSRLWGEEIGRTFDTLLTSQIPEALRRFVGQKRD